MFSGILCSFHMNEESIINSESSQGKDLLFWVIVHSYITYSINAKLGQRERVAQHLNFMYFLAKFGL